MFLINESIIITKNSIKQLNKDKKIKNIESEELVMENSLFLLESEEILNEKAKFSILPKFKLLCNKYPELKEHSGLMSEVEELLAESGKGMGGKGLALKICRCVLRVYHILQSIDSVILLPFCVLLFPIVILLAKRAFIFLSEAGEFKLAEAQSNLMIQELTKLMNETKDNSVKKKCQAQIDKIKANKSKLKEDVLFETMSLDEAYNIILEGVEFEDEIIIENAFLEFDNLIKY